MPLGIRFKTVLLIVLLHSGCGTYASAQTEPTEKRRVGDATKSGSTSKSIDLSDVRKYTTPELERLELLVGVWNVTETHFNRSGDVVATVKGSEEIRWILDGHAIRRDYQTETGSGFYQALGTLTYSTAAAEYRGVWFDNASESGPTYVYGEWHRESRAMVFRLESFARDGKPERYRIVEQYPDEERRVATTYLLQGSDVVKRLRVDYVRAVPCPARVRGVFGELTGNPGE